MVAQVDKLKDTVIASKVIPALQSMGQQSPPPPMPVSGGVSGAVFGAAPVPVQQQQGTYYTAATCSTHTYHFTWLSPKHARHASQCLAVRCRLGRAQHCER